MAPAATPMMANGVESWNQPVMATSVVYIQKDEGRKAVENEINFNQKKTKHKHKNVPTIPTALMGAQEK